MDLWEDDALVRPAARRAAEAFLARTSLPGARFVGLHGLEAVATCPLREEQRRRSASEPVPYTVGYTVRDVLVAELHVLHACADAFAVLVPGDRRDTFATVSWPTRLDGTGLTPREVDVLALVLARFADAEIAERLVVSPATVRSHVRAIRRKLAVGTRRTIRRRVTGEP